MTKPHQRKQAEQKGRWAEAWVSVLLWCCLFRRLAHRHRNPFGEIDLIFCRGDLLLFIEVKYRHSLGHKSKAFDQVEMLMPYRRQKRLIKAAHYYWSHYPEHHHRQMRFDLVVVHPTGWLWWFANGIIQNDK